jgi:hypothetical protein
MDVRLLIALAGVCLGFLSPFGPWNQEVQTSIRLSGTTSRPWKPVEARSTWESSKQGKSSFDELPHKFTFTATTESQTPGFTFVIAGWPGSVYDTRVFN